MQPWPYAKTSVIVRPPQREKRIFFFPRCEAGRALTWTGPCSNDLKTLKKTKQSFPAGELNPDLLRSVVSDVQRPQNMKGRYTSHCTSKDMVIACGLFGFMIMHNAGHCASYTPVWVVRFQVRSGSTIYHARMWPICHGTSDPAIPHQAFGRYAAGSPDIAGWVEVRSGKPFSP